MPPNVSERSSTVSKPQEEHFSDVIGNSYILHTAHAYIQFSQFLYFWPNRTESFESRKKKKKTQYKCLGQLLEGLGFFPPPFLSLITGTHWKSWDRLEIQGLKILKFS